MIEKERDSLCRGERPRECLATPLEPATPPPPHPQANTLAYFETLCADTATANMLINSSLASLLVRMLRSAKVPALRARLAGIIGVLVRHATYISDDLAATARGLCLRLRLRLRRSGKRCANVEMCLFACPSLWGSACTVCKAKAIFPV